MSLVAIVGRPNVGKSTLFNRLVGMRQAIVDDTAGVTRDRHYGKCEWCGTEFSVVDTGGYTSNSDDIFEGEIRKQVKIAIEEADVILFLVEVGTGITDFDEEIADILRRTDKPVMLVVNKVDSAEKRFDTFQFYSLGLGDPWDISSANGSGTGDMLDELVKLLPKDEVQDDKFQSLPRITIVGRPNVGKSSITNAFLGEERNIVTPIAGTTRDSIESYYNKFGHEFMLVDTAGVRKKSKVNEDLEFYSVMRAIRAIEHTDICILMIDAQYGVEAQDMSIFNLIIKNKKGCVVVVNKWDLVEERTSKSVKVMEEAIRARFAPFTDFPIIFASALTKHHIFKVIEETMRVFENRRRRIPTPKLNEYLLPLIDNYPPPAIKGKYIKIKYVMQIPDTQVPTILFFANLPQYVKDPYKRYLENKIREQWDFSGTPLQIFFRDKSPDRK